VELMFGEPSRASVLSLNQLCDSVPVSRLPELVYETKKDLNALGIISTIVGHIGDGSLSGFVVVSRCLTSHLTGNFHALLLYRDEKEESVVNEAVHNMVKLAIALDGTCEH
jgi:D-lactate dehydrogenase (cytochrome)